MLNLYSCGLLVLFISLMSSSCKREQPQPYRNGWSELDTIADRSFFPTGISRWIYEDSVSKQLDTVTLVELRADTIEKYYLDPPILYYTKIDKRMVLYSSRFQKTLTYHTDLNNPFTTIYQSVFRNNDYFALVPLERKLKFETLHGPSGVVEYYNSFLLDGVTYRNVSEIEMMGDPFLNGERTRYFYAPNVGLIKSRNLTTNQVWQLKEVY